MWTVIWSCILIFALLFSLFVKKLWNLKNDEMTNSSIYADIIGRGPDTVHVHPPHHSKKLYFSEAPGSTNQENPC